MPLCFSLMLHKVSGKLSGADATAVECDSVSFWTCEQRYWRLVLLKQFPQAKFFSSHLSWCVTFEWIWFSTTTCGRTEIKKQKNNDWTIKSMNQPIILPPIESKHKMSDLISTDMSPFVLSSPHPCIYVSKLLALSDFLQFQVQSLKLIFITILWIFDSTKVKVYTISRLLNRKFEPQVGEAAVPVMVILRIPQSRIGLFKRCHQDWGFLFRCLSTVQTPLTHSNSKWRHFSSKLLLNNLVLYVIPYCVVDMIYFYFLCFIVKELFLL